MPIAEGQKVKAIVEVRGIRYYNPENNFGILSFKVKGDPMMGTPQKEGIAKGKFAYPDVGTGYIMEAIEVEDPKWGLQYNLQKLYRERPLDPNDKAAQYKYLGMLFTEKQVEAMYRTLKDPYQTLLNNDINALVKVSGCGFKTAKKWLAKFEADYENTSLRTELISFGFTANMIRKISSHWASPDLAIAAIKQNPYSLMEIDGIGWKICDAYAQTKYKDPYSIYRVAAYTMHYLTEMAQQGYSWVYSNNQLMEAIIDVFGPEIPDKNIFDGVHLNDNKLWWSPDGQAVGIKYYIEMEYRIAEKLIELRDGPNEFKYSNWEEIVKRREQQQGWEYTDQQREGIKATLENQVVFITGYGGTGKSSIVAGMISVLANYNFAQCALSGRAAARLAEVTGKEGYTIHRLLGYLKGDKEHGLFQYNEDNPLPYDIVIVDEVSMVGGDLFYRLVKAMAPGTKLIMLGDVGQLESIGCSNIANDVLASPEIKSVMLDKIHRQAAASAIITESINVRNGIKTLTEDYVGEVTLGDLQDLTYEGYSDASNTFYRIMRRVSEFKENNIPLLDMQVIVPNKDKPAGTWNLNLAIQDIYNPQSETSPKKELYVTFSKDKSCFFRVGDKVINITNTYDSVMYEGQWNKWYKGIPEKCPIFNGNIGIVLDINTELREMVVDFVGIGKILITQKNLKNMLLGYAITTHKSQGSEYPYVIFGMDFSGYTLLSRQMVYTAITRASKHCWVIAQNKALNYAVDQNNVSKKQTFLVRFLEQIGHPELDF